MFGGAEQAAELGGGEGLEMRGCGRRSGRRGGRSGRGRGGWGGEFPDGLFVGEAEAEAAERRRGGVRGRVGGDRVFQGGEAGAPGDEFAFAEIRGEGGAGPWDIGELRHEGGERDGFFREDEGDVRPEFERRGGRVGPAVFKRVSVVGVDEMAVGGGQESLEGLEIEVVAGAQAAVEGEEVAERQREALKGLRALMKGAYKVIDRATR